VAAIGSTLAEWSEGIQSLDIVDGAISLGSKLKAGWNAFEASRIGALTEDALKVITWPGRFVGSIAAPLVPYSLAAYGLQTAGDGSLSILGDQATHNIGVFGALTRPASVVWDPVINALGQSDNPLAQGLKWVAEANKVTSDVMLFAAGGKLAG